MPNMFSDFKKISEQMDELSKAMIVNPFQDDFFEVFTRKRVELIQAIMNEGPRSIRDLAQRVERDVKNVFNDLKLLNEFNLVGFEQIGKCKKPIIKRKTIIFKFNRGEY